MARVLRSRGKKRGAEDELEELEPVQPKLQAEPQEDSDDDAPEEVTLAQGRAQADERRRQERSTVAAQQETLKRRRQQQHEAATARKREREAAKEAQQAPLQQRTDEHAAADPADLGYALPPSEDLLPTELLKELASQSKAASKSQASTVRDSRTQPAAAPIVKKKKAVKQEFKKGPMIVKTLKAVEQQAAGTRSTFLRDHLLGGRLRRSVNMLKPSPGATVPGLHPALTAWQPLHRGRVEVQQPVVSKPPKANKKRRQ